MVVGFVVLFVGGGARFAVGLTFKPMVDELGWARGDLGLAVGIYMVVSAFAMFFAGRLADRLGARALLIGGTALGGIGIGLMSLVQAPWHAMLLYGLVFAIGNGAASLITIGVMVTRIAPTRAGLANAAVIAGMSTGQLVMIAALAAALEQIGWRAAFVWAAAAHAVLIPVLLLMLPPTPPGPAGGAPPSRTRPRGAPRARPFW